MRKQFVTYEIAKRLKDLGADFEDILAYYGGHGDEYFSFPKRINEYKGNIDAPLWQQVIDWLREKHNLHIKPSRDGGWWSFCSHDLSDEDNSSPESRHNTKILSEGGAEISDYYTQREKAILQVLNNLSA